MQSFSDSGEGLLSGKVQVKEVNSYEKQIDL